MECMQMKYTILAVIVAALLASPLPSSASNPQPRFDDPPMITIDGGVRVPTQGVDWEDPLSVESLLLTIQEAQGSDSIEWLSARTTPAYVRDGVLRTITRDPGNHVTTESIVPASESDTERMLAELFGDKAAQAAAAGWTCGWGYKKVQYKPGVIAYYWFSLKTDFCWDGTNVQATPQQTVNGDGSWGWAYEGCNSCTVMGWPAPTDYKSYAQGHMNLGTWPNWDRYSWIQHIVHGAGTVSTTFHD